MVPALASGGRSDNDVSYMSTEGMHCETVEGGMVTIDSSRGVAQFGQRVCPGSRRSEVQILPPRPTILNAVSEEA